MAGLYIGLMSGTSLDGVDAVLAQANEGDRSTAALRDLAFMHAPFADALRAELLALNTPGADELHRAALSGNALAVLYANAVAQLLEQAGQDARSIIAIGAHGQTVRHRPGEFDGRGYTLQLLNGALLAELTGIDVVCDLRSRDVAAGGQGAPLVPAFHAACFARPGESIAVLNLGGIANLSLLPAEGLVRGFDCGPANVLMDLWCQRRLGQPYDAGGRWAASGRVHAGLLQRALAEPFLAKAPPKSTGRDLFDAVWLDRWLASESGAVADADVAATLLEFSARAAVDALQRYAPATSALLVCGGGARNTRLMERLAALAGAAVQVNSTATRGIDPARIECLAFAWLAQAFLQRQPGNLVEVTGAAGPRVLGALHPAR
jgi:anhydro-N-acetylmuramic acid kinase